MTRILVTGGAGFIGSHLCDRLVAQGHDVTVVDNFSSGSRANLAGIAKDLKIIDLPIEKLSTIKSELAGTTRIYHLAALISGYDSLYDPDAYVKVNIDCLTRVLEVAKDLEKPRIVFASSSTVYGNQPVPEMTEQTRPNPQTMYALSKLTGEYMLAMYKDLFDYTHVCLRFFNVYGPRQSPSHPYANVTCKFSHAAAHNQGVKLYGDGKQSRDFVYVDDVVESMLAVSETSKDTLYNVGTGKDASIRQLLDEVQRLATSPLPVEQCDPWPNDIMAIRANITRLTEETGFAPGVALREGLARTVAYFQGTP